MAIIGIDIGTSGCKACVFSEQGNLLNQAYREYTMEENGYGIYELNPEKVWESVKYVIACINKAVREDRVRALSLSVSGDEIIPVDVRGCSLHNAIMSADIRGEQSVRHILNAFDKEYLYHTTGIPIHRKYGINRAVWYQSHRPDIYARVWRFLTWEDFIYCRMGIDNPVCSDSTMARLMILNIHTKVADNALLDHARIDPDKFSKVVPSGTPIGTLPKRLSEELGFTGQPLVVTGGFDQSCAAFGAGIYKSGTAMVGTGTMESLCVCADHPVMSPQLLHGKYPCNIHVVANHYNCTATNVCGGALLKWLRDSICRTEQKSAAARGKEAYDLMLEGLRCDPSGLLVLPHFAGAGPPSKDAESLGAILGLTLKHTTKDIVQAVLEGITFDLRQNIEHIENGAGLHIESLTAVGGGARSDYWLKLKSDITGKPVKKAAVEEAGCVAAAMLSWMALFNKTAEEAVKTFVRIDKTMAPDTRRHRKYSEFYNAYKQIYPSISGISHQINTAKGERHR